MLFMLGHFKDSGKAWVTLQMKRCNCSLINCCNITQISSTCTSYVLNPKWSSMNRVLQQGRLPFSRSRHLGGTIVLHVYAHDIRIRLCVSRSGPCNSGPCNSSVMCQGCNLNGNKSLSCHIVGTLASYQ